ncbi:DUF4132 domain-containing protein [Klebsiella aerogenes]|uniref:DUF4132 domain-containing protein n=1 Tax=Klebsiella aerogenes TaxID=548 RepID=UPI00069A482E|nr:DUF4132 domain-containing protein [Klebsiella aerogenes]EMB4082106.1 DUF4132 domain-containing protein [Klebsiella aerogenes]MDK6930103.1 DUF4132 domain-containing protein [Klebsiella aerogenes]
MSHTARENNNHSGLPKILLSPPWRSKKTKKTSLRLELAVLCIPPQEQWLPGEKEALAAAEPACFFNRQPLTERIAKRGSDIVLRELGFEVMDYLFHQYTLAGCQDHLDSWVSFTQPDWQQEAISALNNADSEGLLLAWRRYQEGDYKPNDCWNLYLLAQLPREQLLTLWQRINEEKFRYVGADYVLSILGVDALPGLLLALQQRPKEIFPLLIHIGAAELALPIARAWHRLQAQSQLARQWLLQWPEHAAAALIPVAFGKAGDHREAAINALRLLSQQGHLERLKSVALRWDEPQLWPVLEQLLTQDPLENYPARIAKAPDFWQPARWRRPRLIVNDQPLTDDALEVLGEMLRMSQAGPVYCGLNIIKAVCQPQTLAAFAWDLFSAWQNAGAPAKENWAFQALGILGDESTVRELTPLILSWPQEGKSARASSGLTLLSRIGNDTALMHLYHIAQRAKSRPLYENAEQQLKVIAEARCLSEEQLKDRMVPMLGLNASQPLVFDFGPRQFSVRFDEHLQLIITDRQGVRQKIMPRLREDDDPLKAPEALARLKGLKKDAAQAAKQLLPHLENAFRLARRWTVAEFQTLFVNHPLTCHLTRRLLWGIYTTQEPNHLLNAFRVAAEGDYCDAQDNSIDLPAQALIGIAHPLAMNAELRSTFEQVTTDYQLTPPFPQLLRPIVQLTPEEGSTRLLTRWQGKSATCGQLLGIRYRGWQQESDTNFCYSLPPYRLMLTISPGFAPYGIDANARHQFAEITLYGGESPAAFSQLDQCILSEALSAIDAIFR